MNEVASNNHAVEMARRKAIVESQAKSNQSEPKEEVKRSPTMHPTRMKLAEYERQEWIANAEIGHTVEDCLVPAYWSHMAAQMNPYDHIEVRAEDGSWVADLMVIAVDRSWAKVVLRQKFDLVAVDSMPTSELQHKVEWKGPQHRFCVIRVSDSANLKGEFRTKDEATAWMKEHERVVAG